MTTSRTLTALYNEYNSLAADADVCADRHMTDLMMFALDSEYMDFDGDCIVIPQGGVVGRIEIEHIVGAEDLGSHMAIVLPSSVVLVSKADGAVRVFLPAIEEVAA